MNPKLKKFYKEWIESLIIAFILAMIIRTFVVQAFKIPTGSMIPTLEIGNRLFANKYIYYFKKPERGEIIIFKYPENKKMDFIKRLIGLPGDTIEIKDGSIYANDKKVEDARITKNYYYNQGEYGAVGQKIVVPKDMYYVLGDNSANSKDSRFWGFVPKANVKGRAIVVYWPVTKIHFVR